MFYKDNWIIDKKPILAFALGFDENSYCNLYLGLLKGADANGKIFLDENNFGGTHGKNLIEMIRKKFQESVGDPHEVEEWWIAWSYINGWVDYNVPWEELYYTGIKIFSDKGMREKLIREIINKLSKLSETVESDIDKLSELYRETLGT